jgi:hypothetical protein
MPRYNKFLWLLLSAGVPGGLVLVAGFWCMHSPVHPRSDAKLALSALADPPEWTALKPFQYTIGRGDFEALLTKVFTTGETWRDLIQIDDHEARIQTGLPAPNTTYHLAFRTPDHAAPAPRYWRATHDLPATTQAKPLAGLHLAIDPGHIGGAWAGMEERRLVVGSNPPVCEGDLTLKVAKLLKPRLETLGATVSLVRQQPQPVTTLRPKTLLTIATKLAPPNSTASPHKLAERLFYRTAEIHARAEHVNLTIKPDLVLCLHFNADAWGGSNNPVMVDNSHLHLLLGGAFNDEELSLADQRFAMLYKLLQRTHEEEVLVGASVAGAMAAATGLPPFRYQPNSNNARPVADQPYLWARNLLANRLYQCPVIFIESYVMNSTTDYARILAGDYAGLRQVAGQARPSIFREYADAIVTGLSRHYAKHRKVNPSSDK